MKKIFYLSIAFIGFLVCPQSNIVAQEQGIGINATGAPADNSAGLDVNFNNKGALMPRLTSTQISSIASPATGLTVFNSTCGGYSYNAGTKTNPNWVIISSTSTTNASVAISASPVAPFCSGVSITFTAAATNGGASPAYQWQVNGSNEGSNSSTYAYTPNSGDVISCIMTSSNACAAGSPATSNGISAAINTLGNIGNIMGPSSSCQNSSGNVYYVNPVAGATNYNWTLPTGVINDMVMTAGAGTDSITLTLGNFVGNVGTLSVQATNSCGGSQISSISLVTSNDAPVAPVGFTSGLANQYENSTGNYSINSVTYATFYTWTVSGLGSIAGGQSSTSVTVQFGADTGETIYVSAGNSCGSSAASDSFHVSLCTAQHGTRTFSYTGGVQTYTTACTSLITIQAYGAAGGNSGCCSYGYGGYATGSLTVLPFQALYIYSGGQGANNGPGWNGGGYGGYNGGWGGGGATDVRTSAGNLSTRVIVAGGGGGSATNYGSYGGGGGGTTAGNGTESNIVEYSYSCQCSYYGCFTCENYGVAYGGYGGTQGGGGSYGYYNAPNYGGWNGQSGTFGNGGNTNNGDPYYDGGGGGGYYGGGSGATFSNWYWSSSGGGGSSYTGGVSNGSTLGGVNSGNGYVILTW